ncbi:hypothetical protein L2E82_18210 [Cichorium intybus]|uniref:Uncharacterized protein n=1 Tax=Cichorium intybus TaxID=13427 RepID=A0ACB9FA21_CICIN|nr:hypothetical protein L2E82_18210 [Cichorium intybus]
MSTEEVKIFRELEKDVERDLEEEIKDGIYHLAFRLHRLYQHQKERYGGESSDPLTKEQQHSNNKTLSELNINIRMENGTKIEIKETKNGTTKGSPRPRSKSSASVNLKTITPITKKKFNWENTLRSEPTVKKIDKSRKPISLSKDTGRDIKSNRAMAKSMENRPSKKNLLKISSMH